MRKSRTMAKVRAGEPVRMCGLGHFIPAFICHAAEFGYDCIWLDLEHRCMGEREIQALMPLFHLYDIDCMLRAPTLEKTRLYRYLEDGVTGLMIPHVSTPEKAHELAQATKFPPLGDRGFDGAGLDCKFIHEGGFEYCEEANQETFLAVQIETPQAIENLDAIAGAPGVDALFLGPADLTLRIGHANVDYTLEDAQQMVADAAKKHGKAWGQPAPNEEGLKRLRDMGAQLLNYGGDFGAIMNNLKESQAVLDRIYG